MTMRKLFTTDLPDGKKAHLYEKEGGDQEIYIDGAWGFTFTQGACKLNLYTVVPTAEQGIERREVAARITMFAPTFFALRDFLIRQCEFLEEQFEERLEDQTGDDADEESKKSK